MKYLQPCRVDRVWIKKRVTAAMVAAVGIVAIALSPTSIQAQEQLVPDFLQPEAPDRAEIDPWWVSLTAYGDWSDTLPLGQRELLDGVLSNAMVEGEDSRRSNPECGFSGPTVSHLPWGRGKQEELQKGLSTAVASSEWIASFVVESRSTGLAGTTLGTMLRVREVDSLKGSAGTDVEYIFFPSADQVLAGTRYCSHHPSFGAPPAKGDELLVFFAAPTADFESGSSVIDLQFQAAITLHDGDRVSLPKWSEQGRLHSLSGTRVLGEVRAMLAERKAFR